MGKIAMNQCLREHHTRKSQSLNTFDLETSLVLYETTSVREKKDLAVEEEQDEQFKFANYTLQAFGQTFNLHLIPYVDFISPHYTLEVIGKQEKEDKKEDSSPKHCFYSGYVNESPNNTATVS